MSDDCAPRWGGNVPWCDEGHCVQYDGKRCRLTGFRPGAICGPAVQAVVEERDEARKAAGTPRANDAERAAVFGAAFALARDFYRHHVADTLEVSRRALADAREAVEAYNFATSEGDGR